MSNVEKSEIVQAELLDINDTIPEELTQASLLETDEVASISEKSLVKIYEGTLADSTELSLKSQRLFRVIVSLVKPHDVNNKTYAFNVADYQKLYGMTDYPKKQLLDASDELTKAKLIPYKDSPKDFTRTGLITYFDVKDGVVTFGIAPRLLPYYKLAKEKQQYMLGNTKKFESSHSFFFYELFLVKLAEEVSTENEVEFYLTLNELRQVLKLGNTYMNKKTGAFSYGSFNNRVLKPVYEDINKKINDEPVCNINFNYLPQKAGRSVVGLTFKVWRVRLDVADEPVLNIFYEGLANDIKLGYDELLSLNLKKAEIEKAILTYKEDRFRKIVKYIKSKKYKGTAYIAACLRNGWVDNDDNGSEDFVNISKAYNLSEKEVEYLREIEAFLALQADERKEEIKKVMLKAFEIEPQIYKHIANLSVDEILATRDIKTFYFDRMKELILAEPKSDLAVWFDTYRSLADDTKDLGKGREAVVAEFENYHINKNAWTELLKKSDELILANIKYCVETYQKGKRQKDIAGAIIAAVKNDYAQFEVKAKEAKLAAEKEQENHEFAKAVKAYTELQLENAIVAEATDKKEIVEAEIQYRKDQEKKEADEAFKSMYETFLEDGTAEDKELYKHKTLESMVPFAKQTLAKKLKVAVGDLPSLALEQMLSNPVFVTFFKGVLRKEFGL